MAEYEDREHFIPLRKSDLIKLLMDQPGMTAKDREDLDHFCTLVVATYHFEYHKALERLKDAYAPFDPDADTKLLVEPSPAERKDREGTVFKEFGWLMERANFERKGEEDIEKALTGAAEGSINMDVDLKVFERYEIYARGDTTEVRQSRKWWKLWKVEEKTEEIWKRLVLVFKLQPHKRLGKNIDFSKIYVRVYKDIPKMDLETLIPGAQPEMSWWDKGNIGVPVATGILMLLVKIATVFSAVSLALLLALDYDELDKLEKSLLTTTVALATFGVFSYAFKSYSSYLNLKNKYEKNLSQALYYQTLDGNAGVLFRLLDEAEEQECREAILAYYFLWKEPKQEGWTSGDLDDRVEEFIDEKTSLKIDFEIDDALDKLEKLRIVEKIADGRGGCRYKAQPMEKVLEMLDFTWDNYFKFNNPEPEEPPIPEIQNQQPSAT